MSAYRYEGPMVKEETVKSEAKALSTALKNADKRKPIEDEEVIRILATRSKPHLRELYKLYKEINGSDLDEVRVNWSDILYGTLRQVSA